MARTAFIHPLAVITHFLAVGVGVVGCLLWVLHSPTVHEFESATQAAPFITTQAVPADDDGYGSVIVGEITSVYDGDTFKVSIPEWPDIIGKEIGIRVSGIDTPERRGTSEDIKLLAAEARQITVDFLHDAEVIELRNMQRGKYFRIIADVYADGQFLSKALVDTGLAKPYDGGTRPQWTQEDYDDYFRNGVTEASD